MCEDVVGDKDLHQCIEKGTAWRILTDLKFGQRAQATNKSAW